MQNLSDRERRALAAEKRMANQLPDVKDVTKYDNQSSVITAMNIIIIYCLGMVLVVGVDPVCVELYHLKNYITNTVKLNVLENIVKNYKKGKINN